MRLDLVKGNPPSNTGHTQHSLCPHLETRPGKKPSVKLRPHLIWGPLMACDGLAATEKGRLTRGKRHVRAEAKADRAPHQGMPCVAHRPRACPEAFPGTLGRCRAQQPPIFLAPGLQSHERKACSSSPVCGPDVTAAGEPDRGVPKPPPAPLSTSSSTELL